MDEQSFATEEWFNHPDVAPALETALTDLVKESDRGAVLIAADMISNHLDKTLHKLAPDFLRSKVKKMTSYPGIASTLSGKADIAALNGWITEKTYYSISHLRSVRNVAAHSDRNFSLEPQRDRLAKILSLGNGIPTFVHNLASEVLVQDFFERVRKSGEKLIEDLGENPFASRQGILERLEEIPDWSKQLEKHLPRLTLGLGVCLIIWMIAVSRERVERLQRKS